MRQTNDLLQLISGALRLSQRVLSHDTSQLSGQLLGASSQAIESLLSDARSYGANTSILPYTRSLFSPDGTLRTQGMMETM